MQQWSEIATTPIADHVVTLFFELGEIGVVSGPGVTFRRLAEGEGADFLPADQSAALGGRYADDTVWERVEPPLEGSLARSSGQDLHPRVQEILSGRRADLATRWRLSPNAARLLKSADLYPKDAPPDRRSTKSITLALPDVARARIAASGAPPRPLRIKLDAVDLILFSTGHGFAQIEIVVSPQDGGSGPILAVELLEAVHALSQFNTLRWVTSRPGGDGEVSFDLARLIAGLCLGKAGATRPVRAFSYTFARADAPIDTPTADLFATYLARHYTSDYVLAEDVVGRHIVRDFDTVGHAIALEGAATIIATADAAPLPDFLTTFKTHTFRRHYLPIALLALHERAFLVEATSRAMPAPAGGVGERLQAYAALLRDSLDFRVRFRQSEVSFISMHNAVNRALREKLGLDRLLAELSGDVAEISALLRDQNDRAQSAAEHRRSRRFWFLSVLGTGVLAALSVSTLVKEGIEVLEHLPADGLSHLEGDPKASFWSFAAGIFVLAGTCLFAFFKRPGKHLEPVAGTAHDGHGFAEHAGQHVVIHGHHD